MIGTGDTAEPEPGPRLSLPTAFAPSAGVDRSPFSRTALVVDDEPIVRGLIASVLARGGWSVVQASDAAAAIAAVREAGAPPDLLVADFEMPGANGIALALSLRRGRSRLPVMLVSGSGIAEPLPEAPCSVLAKPFGIGELLSRVDALTR